MFSVKTDLIVCQSKRFPVRESRKEIGNRPVIAGQIFDHHPQITQIAAPLSIRFTRYVDRNLEGGVPTNA